MVLRHRFASPWGPQSDIQFVIAKLPVSPNGVNKITLRNCKFVYSKYYNYLFRMHV